MLPGGIDGIRLLETLRAQKNTVPVLILSALADVDERVRGLKAGGDDYLTKPFAFAELLARVEALARRGKGEGPVTKLVVEDLELDLLSRQVKRAGKKLDLQPREFRLLEYLMRHAGQVVTRTMLLEGVWDYHFDPQTNVIDVRVSRPRRWTSRCPDFYRSARATRAIHTSRAPSGCRPGATPFLSPVRAELLAGARCAGWLPGSRGGVCALLAVMRRRWRCFCGVIAGLLDQRTTAAIQADARACRGFAGGGWPLWCSPSRTG
jgi:DNA-binding response OmpR family regulator